MTTDESTARSILARSAALTHVMATVRRQKNAFLAGTFPRTSNIENDLPGGNRSFHHQQHHG